MQVLQDRRAGGLGRTRNTSSVILGEVVGIHIDNSVIVNGHIDVTRMQPLARLGYMDYCAVNELFAIQQPAVPDPEASAEDAVPARFGTQPRGCHETALVAALAVRAQGHDRRARGRRRRPHGVRPHHRRDDEAATGPDARQPAVEAANLVLDDGTVLYNSPVICEYLDHLHDGPKLFPAPFAERMTALRRQALGDGLLDALLLWRGELSRPADQRSEPYLRSFSVRNEATLASLERETPAL